MRLKTDNTEYRVSTEFPGYLFGDDGSIIRSSTVPEADLIQTSGQTYRLRTFLPHGRGKARVNARKIFPLKYRVGLVPGDHRVSLNLSGRCVAKRVADVMLGAWTGEGSGGRRAVVLDEDATPLYAPGNLTYADTKPRKRKTNDLGKRTARQKDGDRRSGMARRAADHDVIRALAADGESATAIASKLSCSVQTASRVIGPKVKRHRSDHAAIIRSMLQGLTRRQIATQLGCSVETVARVVKAHYRNALPAAEIETRP